MGLDLIHWSRDGVSEVKMGWIGAGAQAHGYDQCDIHAYYKHCRVWARKRRNAFGNSSWTVVSTQYRPSLTRPTSCSRTSASVAFTDDFSVSDKKQSRCQAVTTTTVYAHCVTLEHKPALDNACTVHVRMTSSSNG